MLLIVDQNPNLYLEMPKYGGHVGFYQTKATYYSEQRMLQFLTEL
ncbi:hypothetical protein [Olleya sp. ITB9]